MGKLLGIVSSSGEKPGVSAAMEVGGFFAMVIQNAPVARTQADYEALHTPVESYVLVPSLPVRGDVGMEPTLLARVAAEHDPAVTSVRPDRSRRR
jgi:hypothetical protein